MRRLLSSDEAAKHLGVGTGTLPLWRKQGRGPDYVMIGRCVRYEVEALDRFLNDRRVRLIRRSARSKNRRR